MVLAYHVIFTTYGFWLPNDPRGSWSDFVREWELFWYGPATKTTQRRSLAHEPHDVQRRRAAKTALKHKPVYFTGLQARAVARGFAAAIEESGYLVYACSILPQHVHMVLARHERLAERIVGHLKARATQELVAERLHPFVRLRDKNGRFPSVWAHRAWKVFLSSSFQVEDAIRYVEHNPVKDGHREQHWSFLQPLDL